MFEVRFKKSVKRDLQNLPKSDKRQVLDHIQHHLAKNPFKGMALSGEFKGLHRWRTGKFRIIYEIQKHKLIILVLKIDHRKDAYR